MTRALWHSAFVAAVFAIHPLHVESVAWVAERKDLLSTFFGLLAFRAYVRYGEAPSRKRYLLVSLFFLLSLLSKPMLVTLPCLFLLLDYSPLGRIGSAASPGEIARGGFNNCLVEKIPHLGLAAAASVAAILAQADLVRTLEHYSLAVRVENALVSYLWYIIDLFWPSGLIVFYRHTGRTIGLGPVVASAICLAWITALALRRRARSPYPPVG